MTKIYNGRFVANTEDNFVLFIIGVRINKILSFTKWIPVTTAMGPMLSELYKNPQSGFLHSEFLFSWRRVTLIQYWKSFEDLEAYAHGQKHYKAWEKFNRKIRDDGSVGIFHETYKIGNNEAEAVYNNMPRIGLAKAFTHMPVTKRTNSARERLNNDI